MKQVQENRKGCVSTSRILLGLLQFTATLVGETTEAGKQPKPWPPVVGQAYPDLELIDQTGAAFLLSSFKGKVILLEPVGMNCPACQAFAGAHKLGAYKGVSPQGGLNSIEEYFPKYARGIKLSDPRIVYVQLLLYNMDTGHPGAEDAKKWAEHFRMVRKNNRIVAVPQTSLIGDASYNLIPGFQLIDKSFILQSDASGHNPKNNLWEHLLPMVGQLLGK